MPDIVPTAREAAEAALSNAVYQATRSLEDLEHAGLIRGNGHHMRQAAADHAVMMLRERWTGGDTPTTTGAQA
jgi:flavin-binding protein dodecin